MEGKAERKYIYGRTDIDLIFKPTIHLIKMASCDTEPLKLVTSSGPMYVI